MAKYSINYSCGHTGVEQLYGPGKERARHIEWAEKSALCPECYAAKRAADRAAEIEKEKAAAKISASQLTDAGVVLHPLRGSDKQITWATDIRAKLMADPNYGWAVKAVAEAAGEKALESKYWIDRRSRIDSNWMIMAMPGNWSDAWTAKDAHEANAVWMILRSALGNDMVSVDRMIAALAKLAIIPVGDKPVATDSNTMDRVNWLVRSWSHTGLVESLTAKIEAQAAAVKPAIERAAELSSAREELSAAVRDRRDAESMRREAAHDMEQAANLKRLADETRQKAVADIDAQAMIIGALGTIVGATWRVTSILDGGTRVYAVNDRAEGKEFSAASWQAAHRAWIEIENHKQTV